MAEIESAVGPIWVSRQEYREAPGLSNSELKAFSADPESYHLGITRPKTKEMQWGCDLEDFLLANKLPDAIILPDEIKVRRGKAYDEAVAAAPAGTRTLKPAELSALVESMVEAKKQVESHEKANQLILTTKARQWPSFYWKCDLTQQLRKAELDLCIPGVAIVDLKTCSEVKISDFESQAERLRYHWQAACYQEAVEVCTGEKLPVVFVCVKNSKPYNVETYEMPQDWIDAGAQESIEAIGEWMSAFAHDRWRSPTWGTIVEMRRPAWAKYRSATVSIWEE